MVTKIQIVVFLLLWLSWHLVTEYVLGWIFDPIKEGLARIFNSTYDTTVAQCMRMTDNQDKCLQAANNTKFLVDWVVSPAFSLILTVITFFGAVDRFLRTGEYAVEL
ncbi:hypothetical protein NTE_02530 [Candidatus Nitrososphaera evergladensis SR1]|uniref:Uncharacterized protein n=1 Tax=Candidatus Nitrososphaera evergladensis SR1 TaxID=1459636 RepID=A0A075MV95_9ARCH|nr:hypothetical protein [Candidatus Nitrososphaera evergladensis]AIF84577.1 hypothetical protein NTE_02530 [Candidatus Nitrososphaera evergladensis SR1]